MSVLLWLLPALIAAQQIDPKRPAELIVPLMTSTPKIDGVINDDEWRDATRGVGFVTYMHGAINPRQGAFWFGCDGKRVYVAARTELPPDGKLQATANRKDGPAFNDDSIEIWLHPRFSRTAGDRRYFQFIGNSADFWFDVAYEQVQAAWDGDWEYKNRIADGQWESEASVSLASIGAEAEDMAREWRVHVCRSWRSPLVYSSWSPSFSGFSNPNEMTQVRWDNSAPVVQVRSMGEVTANKLDAKVAVRNPTKAPLTLKVKIEAQPTNQPWFKEEKQLTLAPGEEQTASLKNDKLWPSKHYGEILVTSADGAKTFYRRSFAWTEASGPKWQMVQKEIKPVEFTATYYPYHRKVRAKVDFSGLMAKESAAKVAKANLIITRQGNSKPFASGSTGKFTNHTGEVILELPKLSDGAHSVTLTLDGDERVPKTSYTQTFAHKTWEWEHNQIGKSRIVIPPFTLLQVKGAVVESVLRAHTMNGFGLWDQVESKGAKVLAGPIRLDAQGAELKAGAIKFKEKSPDRVVAESKFEGGPIKASVTCEWDYDGMMKVTLDLARTDQTLDALTLRIPLRKEIATLMHVSSDGIRANPTGAIPSGNGVVWDSTKTVRYNTLGTWIPYVWLGGPERGVCWFADTDRDWGLDDKKPAIEIAREGDKVELRVHLFNTPTNLDRPRRIVFGMQATPVKPMPEGWRSWSFFGAHTNALEMRILGQGQYWGAAEAYSDVYPRKRDFKIFEKFAEARKTGNVDTSFVNDWLKGYDNQSRTNEYRGDVTYGLHQCIPGPKIIPYTNARGGVSGEEGKYFTAEYFNSEPVPSYQDCALFYFKKMMDLGIDGIYYDNAYLTANPDTIAGDAYVRADGNIQPSVGLWNMREFIKRTAVMYHEAGKKPLTVVHMTNGNIIPALSFATIALDWEDKYGVTDCQDKFSTDFLLAESTGLQAGLMPIVIGGVIGEEGPLYERVSRTHFGVATVHEIMIWRAYISGAIGKCYKVMREFGYGLDDCKVFRFWDGPQPVAITGGNAKALVLARGGKAMAIVTDFGEGGVVRLKPDAKTLGLPADFSVRDAESGEALTVEKGEAAATLRRHDFRMVIME
ncbi:MAG: hypothetical protein HY360_26215 [Verrucomicrobia bacterium]|nr:hypothetical protein [Verrucomicrobiota bacterium]